MSQSLFSSGVGVEEWLSVVGLWSGDCGSGVDLSVRGDGGVWGVLCGCFDRGSSSGLCCVVRVCVVLV